MRSCVGTKYESADRSPQVGKPSPPRPCWCAEINDVPDPCLSPSTCFPLRLCDPGPCPPVPRSWCSPSHCHGCSNELAEPVQSSCWLDRHNLPQCPPRVSSKQWSWSSLIDRSLRGSLFVAPPKFLDVWTLGLLLSFSISRLTVYIATGGEDWPASGLNWLSFIFFQPTTYSCPRLSPSKLLPGFRQSSILQSATQSSYPLTGATRP